MVIHALVALGSASLVATAGMALGKWRTRDMRQAQHQRSVHPDFDVEPVGYAAEHAGREAEAFLAHPSNQP